LAEPQAKKFIGFHISREGRSWRTVLRLVWVFFAAAGAGSVDSAAAIVPDVGCSDATGDGDSERAVSVDPGAGFVPTVIIGGFDATRDGGSARAVSVGSAAGFVTTVIIGGGDATRAGVTTVIIGGGDAARAGASERTASLDAGPAARTVVDGFDATRDASSERTGATAVWRASGTIRAGDGS
jgi:hypothetical protein